MRHYSRAGIKKQACFQRRCIHVKQGNDSNNGSFRKRLKPNTYPHGVASELDEVP